MPTRLRLIDDDREHVAEIDSAHAVCVDSTTVFTVEDSGDGRFAVGHDGHVTRGVAAIAGDLVWVSVNGVVFAWSVGSGRQRSPAHGTDVVSSPMPATVVRLAVSLGQTVRAGDLVVALEAMKMELPLYAPRDGVVRAIHCREGELVQSGTILIEI